MTNAIQQNRYDQLLRRVGGIIGPGSKVSEVLTELFPMIDVENVPSELLILAGTRTAMGGGGLGGVAAEAPKFQLFNPTGSGHIVTITRVLFSVNTTGSIQWGRSTAVFSGSPVLSSELTDTRSPIADRPVAQFRRLSSATLANSAGQLRSVADVAFVLENENGIAVLSPGFGYEIGVVDTNRAAFGNFWWRERVAEESELSL